MAQHPPGSLGLPFVGEALTYLKDPFTFTLARTKQYGNVWKTRIMGDKLVFFAGPQAFSFFMNPDNFTRENGSPPFVQEILHRDAVPFLDGERHRARRRLLLAAFTPEALDSYLPNVTRIVERYLAKWSGRGEIKLADDLAQLAFDIADMLFAGASTETSNVVGNRDFSMMVKGSFAPPINLPFTAYGKAIKARDRLRQYIKQAVATNAGKGSALAVLKDATGPGGEKLPPAELEIELLHFYAAAHAGLMGALAWCLVVLGQHPDLAARLREEADKVLGEGPPTYAQVKQLAQARAVSRELLRAYPIAPNTFVGVAKKDLELDGYTIPKGWKGAGAIWATLHDDKVFRDPTRFDADRLGDDKLKALPENAYVPQGGGTMEGHRCTGEALVQTLLPAFLAWFTKRYDLTWPAQDTAHAAGTFIGPMPKGGVRAKIDKRA